jgi:uncharacterized Fe-S center protein
MARTDTQREETQTVVVRDERRTCDKCGAAIAVDAIDMENDYAHELIIQLDQEECVHFSRIRDYCPACLAPIWEAICELIGSDPNLDGWDPPEE